MPTYQYSCTACGEPTEMVQKFSDDPLTVCPACGGRLRKVFSPVGIVFKGSGFYRTDSRAANGAGGKDKKPDGAVAAANGGSGKGADRSGGSGSPGPDGGSGASGGSASGPGEKKTAQTAGAGASPSGASGSSGSSGSSGGPSSAAASPGGKVA